MPRGVPSSLRVTVPCHEPGLLPGTECDGSHTYLVSRTIEGDYMSVVPYRETAEIAEEEHTCDHRPEAAADKAIDTYFQHDWKEKPFAD